MPEIADVVGGQIFAGANGRYHSRIVILRRKKINIPCSSTLCTTSLAYQLADNLEMFTDSELRHIIAVIKGEFTDIWFFQLVGSLGYWLSFHQVGPEEWLTLRVWTKCSPVWTVSGIIWMPTNKILAGLAAKRCETWDETDRLQLALIWASYSFRCSFLKQCHPPLPLLFFVIIVGIDIHTAS